MRLSCNICVIPGVFPSRRRVWNPHYYPYIAARLSGEHGIGVAKRPYFLGATAPENLDLMRSIKTAFDPKHILNDHISYLK